MNGFVFEVKRFAVHDGPGLRTTLFLKGCPLRCPWCQNPEGLHLEPRLWYKEADCLRCGNCVAACQERALALDERVHIDQAACVLCKRCLDACPTGALLLDGREVSADEAEETLLQDAIFYAEGGGITLSGGEVMAQWPFALELLRRMRARGVDTAIETCLLVKQDVLSRFLELVDHFIVDIKYFDGAEHRRVLGESNELILANYRYLVEKGAGVGVGAGFFQALQRRPEWPAPWRPLRFAAEGFCLCPPRPAPPSQRKNPCSPLRSELLPAPRRHLQRNNLPGQW